MRVPKPRDSLSWGKRRSENMSSKDASIISSAMSSLNKFSNDGSFMREMISQKNDDSASSLASSHTERETKVGPKLVSSESERPSEDAVGKLALSANQLAAKVMQLRMKGKHEEADKLMVRNNSTFCSVFPSLFDPHFVKLPIYPSLLPSFLTVFMCYYADLTLLFPSGKRYL